MRKIRCAFVVALSVLFFISLTTAKAQVLTNYLYLEVVDSNEKPVKDADVIPTNIFLRPAQKTNEYGVASLTLGSYSFGNFTDSVFKIIKPGYFPFQDLGIEVGNEYRANVRIELLKIPQNEDEEKTLGDEQQKREFLWAAKTGNAASVRRFLKSGFSPNLSTNSLRGASEPKNIPVILFAAASGNAETVKTLLEAGAKVRTSVEPLHSILPFYLHADSLFSPYTRLETQKSKSRREYEDGLKDLIKAGADVSAPGNFGETTLMIAAQKGDVRIAKILLDKKIPINQTDNNGATILMYAMSAKPDAEFSPVRMIDFLIKSGADPNAVRRRNGYCSTALFDAATRGSTEFIKALIAGKANINLSCENGETALFQAVRYKQLEAVKLLLESGADAKSRQGRIALEEAGKQFEYWQSLALQVKQYQPQADEFREIVRLLEAAGAK